MKTLIRVAAVAFGVILLAASTALAAKTFVIAPFEVNGSNAYKYLEKSIPDMFTSRLFTQGKFEPAKFGLSQKISPSDEAAAIKAMSAAGADFIIWGGVTVVGENASIDVQVRDKAGKSWTFPRESAIPRLIQDLRRTADGINSEAFQQLPPGRAAARPQQQQQEPVNQMNPDLIRNQTDQAQTYINPQFRYTGGSGDESRLRSQALNFAAYGMEICDATGDGNYEIFILEERRLHAYKYDGPNRLALLATEEFPASETCMSIRSYDFDNSGRAWIIVNTAVNSDTDVISRIYTFDGRSFNLVTRQLGTYLNVVNMPPAYKPRLIGQRSKPPHLFRDGVYEAYLEKGKEIKLASKLDLPKDFNVTNFSHIPPGRDINDAAKTIFLDPTERLVVASERGTRMASTDEKYSGSRQGIYMDRAMPGMGADTVTRGVTYYIPMRMPVVDLDDNGSWEVLVNKPISTANIIFSNYRYFPESEIQSLQWDGLGLNLIWKTRRIKGSVVDYAIVDANGDGILDLAVLLNTHPGAIGVAKPRAMVVLYPLDLSKVDPNTPPSITE